LASGDGLGREDSWKKSRIPTKKFQIDIQNVYTGKLRNPQKVAYRFDDNISFSP